MSQPASSVGSFGPTPISNSTPEAADLRSEAPAGTSTWQVGTQLIKDGIDRGKQAVRDAAASGPGSATPSDPVQAKPPGKTVSDEMSQDAKNAMADLGGKTVPELQRMVAQGQLPAAIANDPVAMLELNQRFQDFNRMITLISNMMQAEHETLMAIIRNFKA